MGTTIHVGQETKQILENLKKRENISSIDETIMLILQRCKEKPSKSLFGIDKGKKIKIERIRTHEI